MENRYKIIYDIKSRTITDIRFKQGDIDSSVLELQIVDGGLAVAITGETIEFRFLKPDKTIVYQDSTTGVTILDGPNGKLECVLKSNTLAAAGPVACEIHRTKDGKQLTTPVFYFNVETSIDGSGILSTNYISLIDSKVTGWQSDVDVIKAAYDAATHANTVVELTNARHDNTKNTDFANVGARMDSTSAQLAENANYLNRVAIYDVLDVNEAYASCSKDLCILSDTFQEVDGVATGTIGAGSSLYALVTITAQNFNGGIAYPLQVPVTAGDIYTTTATNIVNALKADSAVAAFFNVTLSTATIHLYTKTTASYDTTMVFSINNGNCTGLTPYTSTITYQPLVHPNILETLQVWCGYKYWMVITPLPLFTGGGGDSSYENPSIFASNDLYTWSIPPGVTNPIIPKPAGTNYNADPVLTMGLDGKTVWLTYKYAPGQDQCITLSTTDGFKTMSSPTVLFTNNVPASQRDVAYAVLPDKQNNQYVMWSVNFVSSPPTLVRRTCPTMNGTWTAPSVCTFTFPVAGDSVWHIDVKKFGEAYYIMVTSLSGKFFFGKSVDGITWAMSNQPILTPSYNKTSSGGYKGAILPTITEKGLSFHLWYSTATDVCGGFAFYHTVLTFNRTKINLDYRNDLLSGVHLIYPTLFCDLFETNGTLVTATCGKDWTSATGTFTVSNRYASPSATANAIATYDLGTPNYFISYKVGNTSNIAYLLFRYLDTGSFLRVGNFSDGRYSLQQVGTPLVAFGWAVVGDVVGVMCKGNTINVYINGEVRTTITNSLNNTSTVFGIQASTTGAKIGEVFAKAIY